MSKYHYRGPAVDHSLISPNGRMSKRARKAAQQLQAERLFPAGYWDTAPKTEAEELAGQIEAARRRVEEWRGLAARGFQPRKMRRAADAEEKKIAEMEEKRAGLLTK